MLKTIHPMNAPKARPLVTASPFPSYTDGQGIYVMDDFGNAVKLLLDSVALNNIVAWVVSGMIYGH